MLVRLLKCLTLVCPLRRPLHIACISHFSWYCRSSATAYTKCPILETLYSSTTCICITILTTLKVLRLYSYNGQQVLGPDCKKIAKKGLRQSKMVGRTAYVVDQPSSYSTQVFLGSPYPASKGMETSAHLQLRRTKMEFQRLRNSVFNF